MPKSKYLPGQNRRALVPGLLNATTQLKIHVPFAWIRKMDYHAKEAGCRSRAEWIRSLIQKELFSA